MKFTEFTIEHYERFKVLLELTEGVSNRSVDGREGIVRYLKRNKGHSFCAFDGVNMVGCALCGHDGRRGYLQHVMVDSKYRKKGIAKRLVKMCLDSLEQEGILKTHIDVFKTNDLANEHWAKSGWQLRDDINRYSFNRSPNPNL